MATSLEIAELRAEIRELVDAEPYTDAFLGGLIDSYGVTDSAHKIWISKRNSVASLVDISEGGSSRKMSQLFDNYDKIVKGYESNDDGGTDDPANYAPRTRKAERI
jgi:hypothetical protein